MKLTRVVWGALLSAALPVTGCGTDSGGVLATGGSGGTGGAMSADPCVGHPACVICAPNALPQLISASLPEGLRVPVDFSATPDGDVVQGATVSIMVDAEVALTIPQNESIIAPESTATFIATSGGVGTLGFAIPEQMLMGEEVTIQVGSGSADFTVDPDATELVIGLDSILVNLDVITPWQLELNLDVSETGICTIEGDGVVIPVEAAP